MPIEIIHTKTDTVIETLDPEGLKSRHQLEKIEDGLNINMNHDEFHTLIVDNKRPEIDQ